MIQILCLLQILRIAKENEGGNDDYMKALRKRNRRCYNLFWNCLKHPVVYVAVVLFYFFFAMSPVTTSNC